MKFHDKIVTLSIADREKICRVLTFRAIQPDLAEFGDLVYTGFCCKIDKRDHRPRKKRRHIRINITHDFGLGYVFPLSRARHFLTGGTYFDTPLLDRAIFAKINERFDSIIHKMDMGVNSETRVNCVAVRSSCDTRELFYNCPAGYIIWLEGDKNE